ncbi:MAG: ATP synthase F1 subunit gamma [bacterium]
MGSLTGIRRRIKSAKNISQITRAMEMVSASKMRKAQDSALSTRPFTEKLGDMISRLSAGSVAKSHGLAGLRPEKNILVVLSSTTKGLCGGLNVNLYRGFRDLVEANHSAEFSVVVLGTKAKWTMKGKDIAIAAKFSDLGETVTFEESRSVSSFLIDTFLKGEFDSVYMLYPKFLTTLTNEITAQKLLPILPPENSDTVPTDYTIEPSGGELISMLMPYQLEMSVYQILLESRATEHSARMVAMKNASDNAKELIGNLTLDYNQARQSQVTSELLDVTTARMALE